MRRVRISFLKTAAFLSVTLVSAAAAAQNTNTNKYRDGDLIFQTSLSQQSKAIQLATHAPWSHCGIIYKDNNQYYVLEAIQPVSITPLTKWINRGKDHHYVVKRLKNADSVLSEKALKKMKAIGKELIGKGYDIYFDWSDEKIYCSELIWKIYKRATGIELGQLQHLRDFDLKSELVQKIMKARYGNNIPLDEEVISPVSMFNSPLLITVK